MEERMLYFDCSSGISGDMVLGALLDLGVEEQAFLRELDKLRLEGFHITIEETQKNGIRAKRVSVHVDGADEAEHEEYAHSHGHPHTGEHGEHIQFQGDVSHGHPHRTYADIRHMIEASDLSSDVKALSLRIFGRVAKAEAKVHGRPVDEVHFHEVGAVDSIVDIVGCAVLFSMLRPQVVMASTIHEGHGYVRCQHGRLSVPVPATLEIFADAQVPFAQIDIEGELVTPTGAAIIAELASAFGNMPPMRVTRVGWGAGTKTFAIPNVLKIYDGYAAFAQTGDDVPMGNFPDSPDAPRKTDTDEIVVMETNLDDCTGEMLGRAMDVLLAAGALDVFFTPIWMKKNRPAYRLTVLARPTDERKLADLIFIHTTTIGIRKRYETRSILPRETVEIPTRDGVLRGKKVSLGETERVYPEYESAVRLSEQSGRSLWEIYRSCE